MKVFVNGDLVESHADVTTPREVIDAHMRDLYGDDAVIAIELTSAEASALMTSRVRAEIYRSQSETEGKTVDAESNLGTAADGASLSLTESLIHISAVAASGGDFATYCDSYMSKIASLESNGDAQAVVASANALLEQMAQRQVLMPFMIKGLGEVVQDVAQRGTAATKAIAAMRRKDAINDAYRQIIANGDAADFLADGTTVSTDALERVTGFETVSVAEREAAMAL